jgi:hypothetical protein
MKTTRPGDGVALSAAMTLLAPDRQHPVARGASPARPTARGRTPPACRHR